MAQDPGLGQPPGQGRRSLWLQDAKAGGPPGQLGKDSFLLVLPSASPRHRVLGDQLPSAAPLGVLFPPEGLSSSSSDRRPSSPSRFPRHSGFPGARGTAAGPALPWECRGGVGGLSPTLGSGVLSWEAHWACSQGNQASWEGLRTFGASII